MIYEIGEIEIMNKAPKSSSNFITTLIIMDLTLIENWRRKI